MVILSSPSSSYCADTSLKREFENISLNRAPSTCCRRHSIVLGSPTRKTSPAKFHDTFTSSKKGDKRLHGHTENPKLQFLATLEPTNEEGDNVIFLQIVCQFERPSLTPFSLQNGVRKAELKIKISNLENGTQLYILPAVPKTVSSPISDQDISETQGTEGIASLHINNIRNQTTCRWMINEEPWRESGTPENPTVNLRIKCASTNNHFVNSGFRVSATLAMKIADPSATASTLQETFKGSMKVRLMRSPNLASTFQTLAKERLDQLQQTLENFEANARFINHGAELEMRMAKTPELLKKVRRDSANAMMRENVEEIEKEVFDDHEVGRWHNDSRPQYFESLRHR